MKNYTIIGAVIAICIAVFSAVGYIGNIVKLCRGKWQAPYKSEILRGVGIVIPPVGIIEGYLTIKG